MTPEINDLKVKAYDMLAQVQYLQGQLQQTNQKIAELSQQPAEIPEPVNEEAS